MAAVEVVVRQVAAEVAQAARPLEVLASGFPGAVTPNGGVAQRRRQAEAHAGLRAIVAQLSRALVARQAGVPARRASTVVRHWETEGRIFAVPAGRHVRYPAFHSAPITGQLRPVFAAVLGHHQPETPWGRALWWTAPSGWLGGRRPLGVLAQVEGVVVRDARRRRQPPTTSGDGGAGRRAPAFAECRAADHNTIASVAAGSAQLEISRALREHASR